MCLLVLAEVFNTIMAFSSIQILTVGTGTQFPLRHLGQTHRAQRIASLTVSSKLETRE
jgi:hypothetical protein